MKIKKTKQEKSEKAKKKFKANYDEISKKVDEFGKLEIEFDRKDFKKKMSTTVGYGFQDMKEKNRLVITELIKNNYDVKFEPKTFPCGGFGVTVKIKKVKKD